MFRIEDAIEQWKLELNQHQTMTASDIEEIETHLRDEMDALLITGLNEEEAFMIASRRIGSPDRVCREFAKINTAAIWKKRFFWMILGVVLVQMLSSFATFLARGSALISLQLAGWDSMHVGVITGLIQFSLMFCFCIGMYWVTNKSSIILKLSKKALIYLMITMVVLSYLLKFADAAWYTLFGNLCDLEQIGQYTMGYTYSIWGSSILWPIVWLSLLIWLMPKKTKTI